MEITDTQQAILTTFWPVGNAQHEWEATQRQLDPTPIANIA